MDSSLFPTRAIVIVVVPDNTSIEILENVGICVEWRWCGSDRRLSLPNVIKLTYAPVYNNARSV